MRRLVLLLVLVTSEAHAWDSRCEVSQGVACPEGKASARHRWRVTTHRSTDEHHQNLDNGRSPELGAARGPEGDARQRAAEQRHGQPFGTHPAEPGAFG